MSTRFWFQRLRSATGATGSSLINRGDGLTSKMAPLETWCFWSRKRASMSKSLPSFCLGMWVSGGRHRSWSPDGFSYSRKSPWGAIALRCGGSSCSRGGWSIFRVLCINFGCRRSTALGWGECSARWLWGRSPSGVCWGRCRRSRSFTWSFAWGIWGEGWKNWVAEAFATLGLRSCGTQHLTCSVQKLVWALC